MDIIKKTVTMHGGREIYILTPFEVNCNITAGHNRKGFVVILSNGSGYQFLSECFSIAAELKKNELLYLPIQFKANDEFKQIYDHFDYNMNIICTNYCETQISTKDIDTALHVKTFSEQLIKRSPNIKTDFIDRWKTHKRLTVKIHSKNLIISTNGDGFSSLSFGASNMAEYGDDVEYNNYAPHCHYDWDENTSKSAGLTLYYWHNKPIH